MNKSLKKEMLEHTRGKHRFCDTSEKRFARNKALHDTNLFMWMSALKNILGWVSASDIDDYGYSPSLTPSLPFHPAILPAHHTKFHKVDNGL